MKPSVLMAWLGNADIAASKKNSPPFFGPIRQALEEAPYMHAYIFANKGHAEIESYRNWVCNKHPNVRIVIYPVKLKSPTDFSEVYEHARDNIASALHELGKIGLLDPALTFHLSPGTPIMALAWVVLAKTIYPSATMIESSQPESGVKPVSLPFDIAFDYHPEIKRRYFSGNGAIAQGEIIFKCAAMAEMIREASKIAAHDVSRVLILGESGTGKELLARHIHKMSPRKDKPFKPINCAAIPGDLLESELFGHKKGAYTGAVSDEAGIFEVAGGGVVFLDEIGELRQDLQVKLLRALQENKIRRVGDNNERDIDVMVISATNRDIEREACDGRFRNDLFYRLSMYILELPPLRERSDDIPVLIDYFLDKINNDMGAKEAMESIGWKSKKLSSEAKKILSSHDWPGNIREMENAIFKAAMFSNGEVIGLEDVKRALRKRFSSERGGEDILNRNLGEGFKIDELLNEIKLHYIQKALGQSKKNGKINVKAAANLLGIANRQTLENWINKINQSLNNI